jgi:hypothetical protein
MGHSCNVFWAGLAAHRDTPSVRFYLAWAYVIICASHFHTERPFSPGLHAWKAWCVVSRASVILLYASRTGADACAVTRWWQAACTAGGLKRKAACSSGLKASAVVHTAALSCDPYATWGRFVRPPVALICGVVAVKIRRDGTHTPVGDLTGDLKTSADRHHAPRTDKPVPRGSDLFVRVCFPERLPVPTLQ